MSRPSSKLHEALTERLGWLRGLARHLVRDDALAEDLVQDTMVAALAKPPTLDRPLEPWLSDVLRRLHLQHRRGSGRRDRRERAAAREEVVSDGTELVARLELVQQMVRAVQELPEPFRTAVALRYESGLTPAQIGQRLRVNGSTVRWRIHEGLNRLRTRLDEENGSRKAWVTALLPLAQAGEPTIIAASSAATWSPATIAALLVLTVTLSAGAVWIAALGATETTIADTTGQTPPRGLATKARQADRPVRPERVLVQAPHPKANSAAPAVATVRGQVLDEGGTAIPGARIGAIRATSYILAERSPSLGQREVLAESTTNSNGEFTLESEPGLLQLVVLDERQGPTFSRPLRIAPGEHRGGIVITAVASPLDLPKVDLPQRTQQSMTERRLRAVWHAGPPAAGIRVVARTRYPADRVAKIGGFHVIWQDARAEPTMTDPQGQATLQVPDGVATEQLGFEFFDGHGSLGITPAPSDPRQVVLVQRRAHLHGTLQPDPLESLQPQAIGLSNGDGAIHTSPITNGSFTFAKIPAGRYELRWLDSLRPVGATDAMVFVMERRGEPALDIVLHPDQTARLHLDRQMLPLIRGRVQIDGEAPRHWQIDLVPPSTADGAPDVLRSALPLGAGGEFHVRVQRPGRYELRLTTANGARIAPLYVHEIDASSEGPPFDLALQTCTVHGRWRGTRPRGQVWLRTQLTTGGTWLAPVQIGADGTVHAPHTAPGVADIVIADHDAATARNAAKIGTLSVPRDGRSAVVLP